MGLIYMVIAFYVAWLGMAVATMGDKLLEFLPLLLLVGVLLPLTGMHFVPEAFGALVALAERRPWLKGNSAAADRDAWVWKATGYKNFVLLLL